MWHLNVSTGNVIQFVSLAFCMLWVQNRRVKCNIIYRCNVKYHKRTKMSTHSRDTLYAITINYVNNSKCYIMLMIHWISIENSLNGAVSLNDCNQCADHSIFSLSHCLRLLEWCRTICLVLNMNRTACHFAISRCCSCCCCSTPQTSDWWVVHPK